MRQKIIARVKWDSKYRISNLMSSHITTVSLLLLLPFCVSSLGGKVHSIVQLAVVNTCGEIHADPCISPPAWVVAFLIFPFVFQVTQCTDGLSIKFIMEPPVSMWVNHLVTNPNVPPLCTLVMVSNFHQYCKTCEPLRCKTQISYLNYCVFYTTHGHALWWQLVILTPFLIAFVNVFIV